MKRVLEPLCSKNISCHHGQALGSTGAEVGPGFCAMFLASQLNDPSSVQTPSLSSRSASHLEDAVWPQNDLLPPGLLEKAEAQSSEIGSGQGVCRDTAQMPHCGALPPSLSAGGLEAQLR